MKKFAFLDTNIFLHYDIFSIDWCKELDCEDVEIIICSTVLKELDEKKKSSNRTLSDRARNLLPKIVKIADENQSLRKNVSLTIDPDEPKIDWEKESLDKANSDDRIIASILQRGNTNDVLITNDATPRFKAKKRGIKVKDLPEDKQLPNPRTEEEREYEKLKQWRGSLPKVTVRVVHDSEEPIPTFKVKSIQIMSEGEIQKIIEEEKEKFDSIIREHNSGKPIIPFSPFPMDTHRYERDVTDYLAKLLEYLKSKNLYEEEVSRIIPISVELHSIGKIPAENVFCTLKFPNDIEVLHEDELESTLIPPSELKKPELKSELTLQLERMIGSFPIVPYDFSSSLTHSMHPQEVRFSQDVDKENNSVKIWSKKIQHGSKIECDTFLIKIPSVDMRGFEIEYTLRMDNFPEQLRDKIPVKIEKTE